MTTDEPYRPEVAAEVEELRARLAEAEASLRAIRTGTIDAIVVAGESGEQVYTLRGADSIYRQLIETMSEGAVTLSTEGIILYGNVRLAEILGRPLDQVLGTVLRDYLPPDDQRVLDAVLAQVPTSLSRVEVSLKTSTGHVVPIYLSTSRMQSEAGPTVFCLVLTDLTDQKHHEQVVATERLARLILEQAAEAIAVCDEQGLVVRASRAAHRFCDGNPLSRPFAEAFPLRANVSDPFHLAPVLQGETLSSVDVALDCLGQRFDLILNAGPLFSGQQILGCVVTLTDISARKRAEAAMRQSDERYRHAVNAPNDGMWDNDLRSGTVHFNERYVAAFGMPAEGEDPWAWWTDHVHPDDRNRTLSSFDAAVNGSGDVWKCEYRFRRLDGRWADTADRAHITRDSTGKAQYIIGALSDLTESRRAEGEIRSQLEELTRWQEVMLHREDRVQQLKREVNELCTGVGRVARYPSQQDDSAEAEAKRLTP